MPQTDEIAIERSIDVAVPQSRAFDVFVDHMTSWWNPEFSIGAAPMQKIVIEPRSGGRVYERGTDGVECDWGRVLAYDPPGRIVIDWQLNPQHWRYEPDLHTELTVRFVSLSPTTTRVELTHRGVERYSVPAERVSSGWEHVLQRFAAKAPTINP